MSDVDSISDYRSVFIANYALDVMFVRAELVVDVQLHVAMATRHVDLDATLLLKSISGEVVGQAGRCVCVGIVVQPTGIILRGRKLICWLHHIFIYMLISVQ